MTTTGIPEYTCLKMNKLGGTEITFYSTMVTNNVKVMLEESEIHHLPVIIIVINSGKKYQPMLK